MPLVLLEVALGMILAATVLEFLLCFALPIPSKLVAHWWEGEESIIRTLNEVLKFGNYSGSSCDIVGIRGIVTNAEEDSNASFYFYSFL
jgi:hypothetical protein